MKGTFLEAYDRPVAAMLILLIMLAASLHLALPAESDRGWLLHAARMWLEGRRLYVDIIEINPPLIVWLYAVPVWISMHVPFIRDFEALGAMGLCACGLSAWVGMELMRLHPAVTQGLIRRRDFGLLLILTTVFFVTQLFFFDREHIMLVMTFPYMLRFMPSLARQNFPVRLRVLVGCMAAVGFLIKPHALVVFTIVECVIMVRERSLRVLWSLENRIFYVFSTLYVALIVQFTPEYFTLILPMAFATYARFGNFGLLSLYMAPFAISAGLVFSDFRAWYKTPFRSEVYYFICVCAAYFVYARINNGWGYTYMPLLCMQLFLTVWMLWEYSWLKRTYGEKGLPGRQFSFGICGCVLVLLINILYMAAYISAAGSEAYTLRSPCGDREACWQINPFAAYAHKHDIHSFGTISFDFTYWVMLQRLSGASWDTRFNHLWMLPQLMMFENAQPGSKDYWIAEYVGKALASDMNTRKPQMMIVDVSPGLLGRLRGSLVAYLSKVPEFKEAWANYRLNDTVDMCDIKHNTVQAECRYEIYRRVP